eukprot:4249207-Pyramimonas_sp.AAC.2
MAQERTQKRYITVVNLSPSTEYAARVAMSDVNSHQWGDWSDVMHVSTLSGVCNHHGIGQVLPLQITAREITAFKSSSSYDKILMQGKEM